MQLFSLNVTISQDKNMNATSATCADEEGEDDDEGEAADMEGSPSFCSGCGLARCHAASAGCLCPFRV